MIQVHILKASGRLGALEKRIKQYIDDGIESVATHIQLPDIDVVVLDNPKMTIPETGVGGYAPLPYILYISIDPSFLNLDKILEKEIVSALVHELHHCARWHTIGQDQTLFDAIVSEGLADHFDIEINGGEPRPWSVALNEEQLKKINDLAKKEFTCATYNHSEWFFGTNEGKIPRWAGYSLGFSIVADFFKKTNKKASEVVSMPSKHFLKN